jgi:hypothetical protein
MKAARSFIISRTTDPVLQCHITQSHSSVETSKLANCKIYVLKIHFVGCEPFWCGRQIPSSSTKVKQAFKYILAYIAGRIYENGFWMNLAIGHLS